MIDRSNCKEMWVWDNREFDKEKRIVVAIHDDGGCFAVTKSYEDTFCNNPEKYFNAEYWNHYEEIKEPKKRLMTREEVLGFIEHNHVVVKLDEDIVPKTTFMLKNNIDLYQYATITADGIIGEWQKFEVEE